MTLLCYFYHRLYYKDKPLFSFTSYKKVIAYYYAGDLSYR